MQSLIIFPEWAKQVMYSFYGNAYHSYSVFYTLIKQGLSVDDAMELHQKYFNYTLPPNGFYNYEMVSGLLLGVWHLSDSTTTTPLPSILQQLADAYSYENLTNTCVDSGFHFAFAQMNAATTMQFIAHLHTEKPQTDSIVITETIAQELIRDYQIGQIKKNIAASATSCSAALPNMPLSSTRPVLKVYNGTSVNLLPNKDRSGSRFSVRIYPHDLLIEDRPTKGKWRISKTVALENMPDTVYLDFTENDLGTQSVAVWYMNDEGDWTVVETYVLIHHPFMDLPPENDLPSEAFESIKVLVHNGLATPLQNTETGWHTTVTSDIFLRSPLPEGYHLKMNIAENKPLTDAITFDVTQIGTQSINLYLLNSQKQVVSRLATYILLQTPFLWEYMIQIVEGCPTLLTPISDQAIFLKNGIAIANHKSEPLVLHLRDILHPSFAHLHETCYFLDPNGKRQKELQFDHNKLGTQTFVVAYEDTNQRIHLACSYVLIQNLLV